MAEGSTGYDQEPSVIDKIKKRVGLQPKEIASVLKLLRGIRSQ